MDNKLEEARQESLRSYDILDTAPDSILDNMTALAAYVCDTPISLISLLDDKRQWFKSKVGLDVAETSRELAFCNFAIDQKELFEVEDATKDKRFKDNPLVTDEPNIRFYAGYPLINNEGFALGTLCVIDRKPRKLSNQQKNAVELLSKLVIGCIENERQQKLIKQAFSFRRKLINEVNFEMRTPLNAIMGISTLLEDKNKDVTLKDDIALLNSSAENMLELIDDLSESNNPLLSNLEEEVTFDLNKVLEQIIEKSNEESSLTINLVYDFAIPEILIGNLERLNQIVCRLISSRQIGRSETKLVLIVEFIDKNSDNIDISFTLRDISENVLPQDSQNLFGQNIEKNYAIEMIDNLQGEFSSKPNQLKFILNFDISLQVKGGSTNSADISGINLLLVEDLETNQKIAIQFLNKWGVNFDLAKNGQEAVNLVKTNQYDVILMDLRMPVMDGYQAIEKIKSMNNGEFRNVPIIVLSASVSGTSENKIKKMNLAGYVSKPFNPSQLKLTIAGVIKQKWLGISMDNSV